LSHYYNRKSYSFNETDEMMTEIKKEMSNFLTKEEAELLLQRKYAMIDPVPYRPDPVVIELRREVDHLRQEIYFLRTIVNKQMQKTEIDEPTL